MKKIYLLIFLIWPFTLNAEGIIEFNLDEEIAILTLLTGEPTDRLLEADQPIAFIFKGAQFKKPLKFKFDLSSGDQQQKVLIEKWEKNGFHKDLRVQICHSFALKNGNYLIITENDFVDDCHACPGLLGMAIVKRIQNYQFEVVEPHTYVAFSGTFGKIDTSEVISLAPQGHGLLMKGADVVNGQGFQSFTLFEIQPMKLITRLSYKVQTNNRGNCKPGKCFQKNVVLGSSAQVHHGYPDLIVRHVGQELIENQYLKTVNYLKTLTFNPKTERYELKP